MEIDEQHERIGNDLKRWLERAEGLISCAELSLGRSSTAIRPKAEERRVPYLFHTANRLLEVISALNCICI